MIRFAARTAFALALASTSAGANVLVVAPTGAPFTTIQAAVTAAVEGDVILVRPGNYVGFTVNAKSVAIHADPEGSVAVQGTTIVRNLTLGQVVVLSGFSVSAGHLRASANVGSLRLEALTTTPPGPSVPTDAHALQLTNCSDVAILRCTLQGGPYWVFPSNPGSGLVAENSYVALYDSLVRGGLGSDAFYVGTGGSSQSAQPGAIGCRATGSTRLVCAGSSIAGGEGGWGVDGLCFPFASGGGPGAAGGTGLEVAASAQVYLRDTLVEGGPGGHGGAPGCLPNPGPNGPIGTAVVGATIAMPGSKRELTCTSLVREGTSVPLSLEGQPGDLVVLNVGLTPRWSLDAPLGGVRLVGTSSRRLALGTLSPTGTLNYVLPTADLGPGVEARTFHLQAYFRDVVGGTHAGSAAVLTVLDASF